MPMTCPACGRVNASDHQFCSGCGTRLTLVCGGCGASHAADHAFCGHCGQPLAAAAPPQEAPPALPGVEPTSGERRQLTALFCDLVDAPKLADRLDPEDYRTALRRYHEHADAVIARHGGHVAQHLGDGLLVYFGWPQTYDDVGERAIRAALGLVEAAATVDVEGTPLAVRVGLHTGTAVLSELGDGARHETVALGSVLNIAARVQSAAPAGRVVISSATHRLVAGLFVVEELGAHTLKGVPDPVELYAVVRPSGVRGRLAVAAAHGLTPFVNRTDERALLFSRFDQASDGEGQVVLLKGEAGIGKSRLAQVLRQELADTPHTWLETGGAPHFANTPFYAVSELLKQLVNVDDADDAARRAAALAEVLASAGLRPAEALPLVAPLLEIPVPATYATVTAAPEIARKRLLTTLAAWVFGTARAQPLVILLEDLHWVDPSTLDLQQLLVEQGATERLLLLYTTRPEFNPPWRTYSHHTHLTLNRLPRRHVRDLVTGVAAQSKLLADVIDAVVARADGVPLFIEELTKIVVESGSAAVRQIPTTLADSLMARLDRLGTDAKEVAQVGAVCGREFSYALVRDVHGGDESVLADALQKLFDAELIYTHGLLPDSTYTFKHALVQDAAYQSLLKSRRRGLHGRAAAVLRQQVPAVVERQPELLAHHYSEADMRPEAVAHWQRAGERAHERGAPSEAERYLSRGLEVLDTLPDDAERAQLEFPMQLALGKALVVTKGYSAPVTAAAFARALAVGERLAAPEQLVSVLLALGIAALHRDGPGPALPFADQVLPVAYGSGMRSLQTLAHLVQGITHYQSGNLATATAQLTEALALWDDDAALPLPLDPAASMHTHLSFACWQLGRVEQARAHMAEAVARAARSPRAADRAMAEQLAATLEALLRNPAGALAHAERAMAACSEEANPVHGAVAIIVQGWALAELGETERGLATLHAGIDALVATGQRLGLELYYGFLSDVLVRAGDVAEALHVLSRGEEACPTQLVHHAGTLHRRANLLALQGAAADEVEAAYTTALDWTQAHDSISHALRIATSYALWLCDHDRADEARAQLEPRVARIVEGHDTHDVIVARALLARLDDAAAAPSCAALS